MPCAAYQLRAESHADPGLGLIPGWWVGGFVQMGLFLGLFLGFKNVNQMCVRKCQLVWCPC